MHAIGRVGLVFTLLSWMVCSAAIAPEHVHEADEHHSHSVTHRHFEAHDSGHTEIEHDDGRVIWLDGDVAVPHAAFQFTVAGIGAPTHVRAVPALSRWMLASILDAAPPHGPPRPYTPLRAPPLLSA